MLALSAREAYHAHMLAAIERGPGGPILDPEIIKGEVEPDQPTLFSVSDIHRIKDLARESPLQSHNTLHFAEQLYQQYQQLAIFIKNTDHILPEVMVNTSGEDAFEIIIDPEIVAYIDQLKLAMNEAIETYQLPTQPPYLADAIRIASSYGTTVLPLICRQDDILQQNRQRQQYNEQLQAALMCLRERSIAIPCVDRSIKGMSSFEKHTLINALNLSCEDTQKFYSISTREYLEGRLLAGESWSDIKADVMRLAEADDANAVEILRQTIRSTLENEAMQVLEALSHIAKQYTSKTETLHGLLAAAQKEVASLFENFDPEEASFQASSRLADIATSVQEVIAPSYASRT